VSTNFWRKKMAHLELKKPKEKLKIVDYNGQRIIHFEHSGDILGISGANPNMIDLVIGEYDDTGIFIPKADVQTLINYFQNWVDTGDFEGEKEAESNEGLQRLDRARRQ
jgi:hypothetical protein